MPKQILGYQVYEINLDGQSQQEQAKSRHHHDKSNTITHIVVLRGLTENDEANIKHSVDKWRAEMR